MGALLARAAQHTDGQPVYAFSARDNLPVRAALEEVGFAPLHSTAFYSAPLDRVARHARVPDGYRTTDRLPVAEYRALYRAAEDAWAGRLDWTPSSTPRTLPTTRWRWSRCGMGTTRWGSPSWNSAPTTPAPT